MNKKDFMDQLSENCGHKERVTQFLKDFPGEKPWLKMRSSQKND